MRQHKKSKGIAPSIGFGNPKESRGLHPSGFRDVLIHNSFELMKLDPKKEAVRFAKIGRKKKNEMLKKAEELKLKVLNP